jgi:hypothetical protein
LNIFYLDKDPRKAAEMHCDKHVVKMIVESAQLLSTAHRILDGDQTLGKTQTGRNVKRWILNDSRESLLYKASHINHPSAVWARSNIDHYRYLFELYAFLIEEYGYRYRKDHKSAELVPILINAPERIDFEAPWIDPPQAMPEECKIPGDTVAAYRKYYADYKKRFAKWTKRNPPSWWV